LLSSPQLFRASTHDLKRGSRQITWEVREAPGTSQGEWKCQTGEGGGHSRRPLSDERSILDISFDHSEMSFTLMKPVTRIRLLPGKEQL